MPEVTFADWTERLKVYNDYIRAVGEAKLKIAESLLKEAEAAQIWHEVRKQQVIVNQLMKDLQSFNRASASMRIEEKKLKEKSEKVSLLLRGRAILPTSFKTSWAAYTWFESRALLERGSDSFFAIKVPASARTESNFVTIRKTDIAVPAPADIGNALQLMNWLHEHYFLPKHGSNAQLVVQKLIAKINAVAEDSAKEMRDRVDKLQKGTYDFWNLASIIGASENAAAKRIEQISPK